MNKLIFGVAILLALLVTVLVYTRMQKKKEIPPASVIETQDVAIAARDLSRGEKLTKETIQGKIKMATYLKESLYPGTTFSSPSALEGRVLFYPVKANEPIFESRLAPTTVKEGGLAAIITPEKRALAVRVDKEKGVAGFIHPGNYVDVLVTISDDKNKTFITKKVLENILVLASGSSFDTSDQEKAVIVDVVSLEVTPEEAEKLSYAVARGSIQLALRNITDNEHVFTRGATAPLLLGSSQTANESEKETANESEKELSQATVFTVELIRGVISEEYEFPVNKRIYEKEEQ